MPNGNEIGSSQYRWLNWAMPILLAAGIAYAIGMSGDRYTGSEAERDRAEHTLEMERLEKQLIREIENVEERLRREMYGHATGGPHDDVREQLIRQDERIKVLERTSTIDEAQ